MTIKEIKKDAKIRTSGKYVNLIIINILYSLFTFAFSTISSTLETQSELPLLNLIILISLTIISLPFSYGVIVSTIKIVRNEDTSSTEFINTGLKNIGKVWKLLLRTGLKLFIPFILLIISAVWLVFQLFQSAYIGAENSSSMMLLALFAYIASLLFFCFKSLSYSLSYYLLYDNPENSSAEILNKSNELMKNNKWKYIGLTLSFIGWYFLIYFITYIISHFSINAGYIVTFILASILTPYIGASQVVFYEDLKENKSTNLEEL